MKHVQLREQQNFNFYQTRQKTENFQLTIRPVYLILQDLEELDPISRCRTHLCFIDDHAIWERKPKHNNRKFTCWVQQKSIGINIYTSKGTTKPLIFTKQEISTYKRYSADKFPRLGGISPANWLLLSCLFLFGDRAIERENPTLITQNSRVE